MHSKAILRRTALLLAVLLLAAACGGGDAEDTAATEDAAGDTATEVATEAEDTATEAATEAGTEATSTETVEATGSGDGVLTIGTVLPQTGSLASLGPPEFAGAEMAVMEINEAGGVLGNDVDLLQGDSGDTTTDIANQTVDQHLANGADVIVGAASSAVSFTFIDKVTGAGVVHFSPANTSADFTTYDDRDLYFRTAPTDILQGRILANLILDDGHESVGLMALQDPYGEGLLNNTADVLEESGATVTNRIVYDPQAQNFDAEVQELVSSDPDAIVVIGFAESARIFSTLIEQGLGPDNKGLYCVDGNVDSAELAEIGDQLVGTRCTLPGAVAEGEYITASDDFRDRLLEVDPELQSYSYAPETYDAVIVSALAAIQANSDAGEDIGAEIPDVTREGEVCTDFASCKDLLEAGEDIDYDGQSGPINLTDEGDPTAAYYQIREYTGEPTSELVDTQFAELDQ